MLRAGQGRGQEFPLRGQVYRHTAGASGSDKLAYEEKDEKFDVYAAKTRSKAYIVLFSASHTTSEARYLPAPSKKRFARPSTPRRCRAVPLPCKCRGGMKIRSPRKPA